MQDRSKSQELTKGQERELKLLHEWLGLSKTPSDSEHLSIGIKGYILLPMERIQERVCQNKNIFVNE